MRVKQLRYFCSEHGLTIATSAILGLWILLYSISNPDTHWGSFFGNAIADWSGVVLMVLGTKIFMERGSKETKRQFAARYTGIKRFGVEHSFSIFVIVTLFVWIAVFNHQNPNAKWGQVVGNIVSEWTQALGLIFLTKRLREHGSEESKA